MSTATESRQSQQTETQDAPAQQSVLDKSLEVTQQRVQSIRHTAAQFLGVPPNKVCDLLRNVWHTSKDQPPLTDQEMFVGMSMIARFGLDPIAREVYVTRTKQGLATIIGIDGWIKILDRTDHYDGFDQEYKFKDDNKTLEWIETRIFSKNRQHPTVYRAYAHEYARLSGFMAEKIPIHMLHTFSLRHAARLFAPIGGSVISEEEARWMSVYGPSDEKESPAPPPEKKSDRAAAAMKQRRQKQDPEKPAEEAPAEASAPPADDGRPSEVEMAYCDRIDYESVALSLAKLRADIKTDADLSEAARERLLKQLDRKAKTL